MPTALVTGASSGFGRGLCVQLVQRGWHVVGTSRSPQADWDGVEMVPLDVCDDGSVAACVRTALDRHGAIDALVNSAGYVHEGPLEEIGVGGLQAIFETNVFGTARMVNATLPGMRARRRGRIINVGSVAGLMPLPFYGAYCAAKHALEGYTESLRHEVGRLGIDISIVEPAFYKTGSAAHKRISSGAIADYEPRGSRMLALLAKQEAIAPAADPVVRLLERLVTNPGRNRLRHVIGKYTVDYWLRGISPEWLWDLGVRTYWPID